MYNCSVLINSVRMSASYQQAWAKSLKSILYNFLLKKHRLYGIISLVTKTIKHAGVAELADALDLGSSGEHRGGSSPFSRTSNIHNGEDIHFILIIRTIVDYYFPGGSTGGEAIEPSPCFRSTGTVLLLPVDFLYVT